MLYCALLTLFFSEERKATAIKRPMTDTNILHVAMSKLAKKAEEVVTGDRISCTSCNALLNHASKLTPTARSGSFVWVCEFCDSKNEVDVEEGQKPSKEVAEFIIEPPTIASDEKEGSTNFNEQGKVIFCVDCSGSMGTTMRVNGDVNFPAPIQRRVQRGQVSRLQCIQAAVYSQIETMKTKVPPSPPPPLSLLMSLTPFSPFLGSQCSPRSRRLWLAD